MLGIEVEFHARSCTDAIVELVLDVQFVLLDVTGILNKVVHIYCISIIEIGSYAVTNHDIDFWTQVKESFHAIIPEEYMGHDGQFKIGEAVTVAIVGVIECFFPSSLSQVELGN